MFLASASEPSTAGAAKTRCVGEPQASRDFGAGQYACVEQSPRPSLQLRVDKFAMLCGLIGESADEGSLGHTEGASRLLRLQASRLRPSEQPFNLGSHPVSLAAPATFQRGERHFVERGVGQGRS